MYTALIHLDRLPQSNASSLFKSAKETKHTTILDTKRMIDKGLELGSGAEVEDQPREEGRLASCCLLHML